MQFLLLIPSILKQDSVPDAAGDRHPRMDYHALADGLRAAGANVRLLDYGAVAREGGFLVGLARWLAGPDVALAVLGFLRRRQCEAFFTNGENVAIPLALLLKAVRRRPGHVTIGHRLSTAKKRLFFSRLRVHEQIDVLFLYARRQWEHAVQELSIPPDKLSLIAFHADERFYRPLPKHPPAPEQICSAGLEWRDYPTLIEAVREMPDLRVHLAAASPWSKHRDETADCALPSHVQAQRRSYGELRELYARSSFVVVPLYETDFQAGVTTLLEAMAMGKAVIVTRTTGQTDVVIDGETGLTVAPGDVEGWRRAITRLQEDHQLRDRLGRNARRWVQEHATLDQWVCNVISALLAAAQPRTAAVDEWESAVGPRV
ncbi:MAG: glycosyltransferase family 4 protein [Actinomycetota bacterium]